MGHGASLDYPAWTKRATALGVILFLVGAITEALFHGRLPAWAETIFFDMEIVGVLIFLISPFLFGIILPLTE